MCFGVSAAGKRLKEGQLTTSDDFLSHYRGAIIVS